MVGFQLSEEDIRHLTEEVTDAKGELSKNDFILHVKVRSVEIILIMVIMMAVVDFANEKKMMFDNEFLAENEHVQSVWECRSWERPSLEWEGQQLVERISSSKLIIIFLLIIANNCKFRLFLQTLKKRNYTKCRWKKLGQSLTKMEMESLRLRNSGASFWSLAKKVRFVKKVDGIAICRRMA